MFRFGPIWNGLLAEPALLEGATDAQNLISKGYSYCVGAAGLVLFSAVRGFCKTIDKLFLVLRNPKTNYFTTIYPQL
jgi:hypothetical protein